MKNTVRYIVWISAAITAVVILLYLLPGCVGAPRSMDDLASMPQVQFDSWKERVSTDAELAANAQVTERPGSAQDVRNLATALRALANEPVPGSIAKLADGYRVLIRAMLLEVSAWIDSSIGHPESKARVVEVIVALADGLERGAP